MSLGVVIKGPEGVVLAADSRITLEARHGNAPPSVINFDNATKLLTFNESNNFVAAVTYGAAVIGQRTAHSYVPEFEVTLQGEKKRLKVEDMSKKLSSFFMDRWQAVMPVDYAGPNMVFIVAGYDPGEPYGRVFLFEIPRQPTPVPRHPDLNDFGMTWGGQLEIASRLIHGYDPALLQILQSRLNFTDEQLTELEKALREQLQFRIPYNFLPLQDCVDLAILLIRTTMGAQALAVGVRGVGGTIDVVTITRTVGVKSVQQKKIRGERAQSGKEVFDVKSRD